MRLSPLELEPRETPSVYYMGGGVLHLSTGHEYQIFPDYSGALVWLTNTDGVTTVAPSPAEKNHPGGPRVAVIDQRGNRVQPDYWAGDPNSREGVALVDTGGTTTQAPAVADAPPEFDVPAETRGDPSDPANWVIDLDFQEPTSPQWVDGVIDEAWRILAPLGNVALVTRRPSDYPGNYGTVVIGADLSYADAQGTAGVRWDEPHPNLMTQAVYVDGRDIAPGFPVDPVEVGQITAHESGHALGLDHDTTPGSVMQFGVIEPGQTYTPQDLLTARAAAAKAVSLEYHADAPGVG